MKILHFRTKDLLINARNRQSNMLFIKLLRECACVRACMCVRVHARACVFACVLAERQCPLSIISQLSL